MSVFVGRRAHWEIVEHATFPELCSLPDVLLRPPPCRELLPSLFLVMSQPLAEPLVVCGLDAARKFIQYLIGLISSARSTA